MGWQGHGVGSDKKKKKKRGEKTIHRGSRRLLWGRCSRCGGQPD